MLLVLMPLVLLVLFLDLIAIQFNPARKFVIRKAFLEASILLGVWIAVTSELLSLIKGLTTEAVAVSWGIALLAALGIGFWKRLFKPGLAYLRDSLHLEGWGEGLLVLGLAVLLAVLFVIILVAPVNNSDSLQYHMSRVMHWAQDQSLEHYATGYEPQLINPIWAEEAVLHIRLLWGDDRFVELVQWAALIGSMLGVSLLAGLLGAGRKSQIAAAMFSASLPLGILQATSTQNDYVVAFWLVCLLAFTILSSQKDAGRAELFFFAGALGLGLLTKATFYPYAVPVLVWFAFLQVRRVGIARAVKWGLVIAGIAAILNLGYWTRNVITYGGPFGSEKYVVGKTVSGNWGVGFIAASVARNVAMNYVTPSTALNARIHEALNKVFGKYDPDLEGFQFTWGWNHEDLAANPLHFLMIPIAILVLFVLRKRVANNRLWEYILVSLALFVMVSFVIKIDQYGIRYQLPFIVTWSPVFGCMLGVIDRPRFTQAVWALLLILMIPWVFYNRTRSVIAFQDTPGPWTIPCSWHLGCSVKSVLVEPPETFLFINLFYLRDPYLEMARVIKANNCSKIGLAIDSWDSEYIFWWILDAPQSGRRIETIYTFPDLEKYLDPNFRPCAVICKLCSQRSHYHGLPLKSDYSGASLYMGDTYTGRP